MRVHTRTVFDMETGAMLEDASYEYCGPVAWCDRSIQQQAQQGATGAGATASQYGGKAQTIGAKLTPTLWNDINNPTGYTAQETNAMLAAGEQGAGGANAGIAGQAGLTASRTRNTAGLSSVLDAASRQKGQQLSQNALGVQAQSAQLAQQKRADALRQMGGMYGEDVNAQLGNENAENAFMNTGIKAGDSGWYQNTLSGLEALFGKGGAMGEGGAFGYSS